MASLPSPSARARLQRGARVWDADAPDPVHGLDPPTSLARLRAWVNRGGAFAAHDGLRTSVAALRAAGVPSLPAPSTPVSGGSPSAYTKVSSRAEP